MFRWHRNLGNGYASRMTTVGDVMTRDVLRVDPSTTVAEAATMMGERRIGSALAMEDERLVGIFRAEELPTGVDLEATACGCEAPILAR